MNRLVCRLAFCLLAIAPSHICLGEDPPSPNQPSPSPLPSISPDTGSVESSPAANPESNLNCWISRSNDRAIAVHVYEENNQLRAKFRQYNFDGESYASTVTKIMQKSAAPAADAQLFGNAIIEVKLDKEDSSKYPSLYKMVFTTITNGTPASYHVGYLNFVRGNKRRASSKVSVTFLSPKNTGDVYVSPNSGDPCEQPVIDDVGEEEEIAKSPTTAKAPTNFVLPIAVVAPD